VCLPFCCEGIDFCVRIYSCNQAFRDLHFRPLCEYVATFPANKTIEVGLFDRVWIEQQKVPYTNVGKLLGDVRSPSA
jgi:hypothetical protein